MAIPVKISVMTHAFGGAFSRKEMDIPRFLEICVACGVDGVELAAVHFGGMPPEEVRRRVDDAGLQWPVYIAAADFVVDDRAAFDRAVALARAEIERARCLEVPHVMLLPGSRKAHIDDARGRELIAEGLRLASEYGAEIGVQVSTENHGGQAQFRGRLAHMLAFVNHAPQLKVTLDDGNFVLGGDDPHEALAALADRIIHVHLKDWRIVAGKGSFPVPGRPDQAYVGAPLGRGVVNTAKTLESLHRLGYDGFVTIEGSESYRDAEALRPEVEYVRKVLASLAAPQSSSA